MPTGDRSGPPDRADALRAQLSQWTGRLLVVRVVRRFVQISGYDRALALATQAFVAIVPMLIVVATAVPRSSREAAATWFDEWSRLSGDAEVAVGQVLRRPPSGDEAVTAVGVVLLVTSVVGFARTLQRTYLAAWRLPGLGLPGFGYGLLAAAALVTEVVVLLLVAPLLVALPGAVLVTALVRVVPSILVWWPVQRLLVGGRLSWRALLPGAVVSGAGQTVVMAVSGWYVPDQIAAQSARFGLIGVAFVLVSWLVVLGLLLVVGAVLGAELATGRRGASEGPDALADQHRAQDDQQHRHDGLVVAHEPRPQSEQVRRDR